MNDLLDTCAKCNGQLTDNDWLTSNVETVYRRGEPCYIHKKPCLQMFLTDGKLRFPT